MKRTKTWKREASLILLGLFCVITIKQFFLPGDNVSMVIALQGYYMSFGMFVTGFAGGMFGIDAWTKQVLPAMNPPTTLTSPPPVAPPTKVAVNSTGVRA